MRMGQGVRTGLGHGGITCVLQTQFSIFLFSAFISILYLVQVLSRLSTTAYSSCSSSEEHQCDQQTAEW